MTEAVVAEYLRMLEDAFRRPPSPDGDTHSLLGNLDSAPAEALDWLPDRGARSIREIVLHVGWAKYMYDDHAFRGGTMRGDQAPAFGEVGASSTTDELAAWLTRAHEQLIESAGQLCDSDLDGPRQSNWGETKTARWVFQTMLEHDIYHAGEINHLRALFMKADRWAYL